MKYVITIMMVLALAPWALAQEMVEPKKAETEAAEEDVVTPAEEADETAAPGPAKSEAAKETKKEGTPIDVEVEALEEQLGEEAKVEIGMASEVELVERVVKARREYATALKALKDFYMAKGDAYKVQWVTTELTELANVQMFRYIDAGDLAGEDLKPTKRIPAADQLYQEGMHYKDYPEFPPGKKDKLKIALRKFETIIRRYPESDKVDDAAFRIGEIYGGWYFKDYTRAVKFYQRCWQWNPNTEHPARLNAAKIYEEKLKNCAKAVELYNKVILESPNPEYRKVARDRIRALTDKK